MKISSYFTTLILFIVFLPSSLSSEEIKSFYTNLYIMNDGSITVIEDIEYDFGSARRHGIFRDIPYKYEIRSGSQKLYNYNLRMNILDVTDFNGNKYNKKVFSLMLWVTLSIRPLSVIFHILLSTPSPS